MFFYTILLRALNIPSNSYDKIWIIMLIYFTDGNMNTRVASLLLIVVLVGCGRIENQAKRGIIGFRNNMGTNTDIILNPLIPTTTTLPTSLIIQYPTDYQLIALKTNQYGSIECPISLTSSLEITCPDYTVDATNQIL